MKTSSPPDQKIDRSHTTTTAGRKPPKPLPDLWIVHHRPQTADAGTHRRSLPSFLRRGGGGGGQNSCKMQASPPLEPALSLSGSNTSSPPKRACCGRVVGSRWHPIRSRGGSIRSRMDVHDGGDGGKRGRGDDRHTPCFEMVVQCRRVQEGNILDVYVRGGRRGKRLGRDGERGWYPTTSSQTRRREPERLHLHQTTIQPKERTKPNWTGIDEETPQTSSPRYHHHIYTTGNTDGNSPPLPLQEDEKEPRPGSSGLRCKITSPHLRRTCTQHGT